MSAADFLLGGMSRFGFFPFGFIGSFSSLVFIAGFVLLAVWVVRAIATPRTYAPTPPALPVDTPLDILARRFAAGEITEDEYIKGRDLLTSPAPFKP